MHELSNDAVVNPVKGKKTSALGPVAVMVSNHRDLSDFCNVTDLVQASSQDLMMSRLHAANPDNAFGISAVGPMIGAPYAAMVMETLIVRGVSKIIYFGWCGSLSPHVRIGDIVVPTGAWIDEGLSGHYQADTHQPAVPSRNMIESTLTALRCHGVDWHEGSIWSTDAVFRETREKVAHFQSKSAIGVEMEISALCSVANFRGVEFGAVCVVSDELATMNWRPGFGDRRFKQSRKIVCEVIQSLCQTL